ncbi:hypothetical protein MNEG_7458, partial [Monoraphidium neglectum]
PAADEADNVAEARAWVDAWKARQEGGSSSNGSNGADADAGAGGAGAEATEDDGVVVVEESNPFDLGKIFSLFGGKK